MFRQQQQQQQPDIDLKGAFNAFYLVFAVIGSVLAWRTGGIEAAVALHAVNNVVSMTFLPFTDFSDMFNRGPGAGSPVVLLQMAILAGANLLVYVLRRLDVIKPPGGPGTSLLADSPAGLHSADQA